MLQNCIDRIYKGFTDIFEGLPPGQRDHVIGLVEQTMGGRKGGKDDNMLDALYGVDYEHRCVDPYTFFTHSDYLGHFKSEIFKAWWPHLLKMCDPNSGIFEIILTGSLGMGKSTIGSGLIPAYYLHRILCLKDAARFYGLAKGSKIIFGVYSISLALAGDTGFYILRDQMLAQSPFFNEVYPRDPRGVDVIKFPGKAIEIVIGSQSLHVAGRNLFFVCVDEMNLMRKGESTAKKAFELANEVSRRIESRFMRGGGSIPGASVFIGSARAETDFTARRIKVLKGKKHAYVVQGSLWDFVGERNEYSGKKFKLQVGGEYSSNKILEQVVETEAGFAVVPIADPDPDGLVVDVPVEHFASFEVDIEGSIKDIAGISTKSFMKLFGDRSRLRSAFKEEYKNYFYKDVLQVYLGGLTELREGIAKELTCRVSLGKYRPIINPGQPRYIHVDLAKNRDRAGIAMVHSPVHSISTEYSEIDDPDGLRSYDVHKKIRVDFAIAVECGPQKESIDFANIRRLVYRLRDLGFWIRMVTMDRWQSEDSSQRYQEAGIRSKVQSVDQNSMPYIVLRNCIYGNNFESPFIPILFNELANLDYDIVANKVDHPEEGSKDVADACAGATFTCLTDKITPKDTREIQEFTFADKTETKVKSFLPQMRLICEDLL